MDPDLIARLLAVRAETEALCEPLEIEDYGLQSMPDASPAKWHLAHTTWFFETFVLARFDRAHRPFHPGFELLFNSYYNGVGAQHPRAERGLLSRPTVAEVYDYRAYVTERLARVLTELAPATATEAWPIALLGLQHEQQHQELLLTDLKHAFARSPLAPVYRKTGSVISARHPATAPAWISHEGGIVEIGAAGRGFSFDNEGPRHGVLLRPFALASRPVTNAEWLEFVRDGGYTDPRHWLSEGWDTVRRLGWSTPLYAEQDGDGFIATTLGGRRSLDPAEPVCHVSYYEADAFARWAGARLPTEAEWEAVASREAVEGNFVESGRLHPAPAPGPGGGGALQLFGDVWEWTASPYVAYPGFRAAEGALGEYNGKFMCGQLVLRGGSCVSPRSHLRASYRNFFPPGARWQFSGLRLARD
jgi:ergothioneine biosynthesis protein EgtB